METTSQLSCKPENTAPNIADQFLKSIQCERATTIGGLTRNHGEEIIIPS